MPVPNGSTVRWFHSGMANAPQILSTSTAGDMLAILDACLIDGFDPRSPDGDKITIASEVATVHFSGGHAYDKHAVIEISGANTAALNDVWRITGNTATTFTFDCPGIADGADAGTISVKRASPGHWEKAFSGTNKAAYRSTHEDASGLLLRVDDSGAGTAVSPVRGYESMTDIDTGTRPFPTIAQQSETTYVWRRNSTTANPATPRDWVLIADESFFYFMIEFLGQKIHLQEHILYAHTFYMFGDVVRFNPTDVYACVLVAHAEANPGDPSRGITSFVFNLTSNTGCWFARPASNEPVNPDPFYRLGQRAIDIAGEGPAFPHPVTGGYLFHYPVMASSGPQNSLNIAHRGFLPGALQGLTARETMGHQQTILLEPGEAFPRPILMVRLNYSQSNMKTYCGFDIHGPWR